MAPDLGASAAAYARHPCTARARHTIRGPVSGSARGRPRQRTAAGADTGPRSISTTLSSRNTMTAVTGRDGPFELRSLSDGQVAEEHRVLQPLTMVLHQRADPAQRSWWIRPSSPRYCS